MGETFSIADLYMALWTSYGLKRVDDIAGCLPAVACCHEAATARPRAGSVNAGLREALAAWRSRKR